MSHIPLPAKINDVVEFQAHGETLTVKKKGAGEYVAYLGEKPRGHARWGNAEEIREDIAYFLDIGALPRGKQMF
jgi:hypothetical protein